jgi:hypothetical protein
MLRAGATQEEVEERSPGENIIPGAKLDSTMAVTLDAPPADVWPWLVQMGYDRAGWYSWDFLDHFGIPSARTLHPEWQALSIGDRLPSAPDGEHWFEVAALEPERFLALRASMSGLRQYDSGAPRPSKFTDSLWEFQLNELPGRRTRLIVRVRSETRPRHFPAVMGFFFWEPAHFIMQMRQFGNLQRRVQHASSQARPEQPLRPSTERPRRSQPRA